MMVPCTRLLPVAFAIVFCGAVQAADDSPGLGLRLQRNPVAAAGDDAALPTFIYGHRIDGIANKESTVEGDAELRKGPTSINADWLRFYHETEDVEARGNVRLERDGDVIIGPRLKYRARDGTGVFDQPEFFLSPRRRPDRLPVAGRGKAQTIELLGEDKIKITDGTFTTCKPGNDDWYVSARQLDLDFGREVGTAHSPRIYFKGVPIIQLPWLDFSLNSQRKSGLLPPTFGRSGRSGLEFSLPYYFNIAPNYDLTLTPRQMEHRGTQLGGVFRYLERNYLGEARMEYLPDDKQTHLARSAISVQHTYASGTGVVGGLTLNKVSDDDYFRDLSTRINATSQSILLREGFVSRSGTWWESGSYSAIGRSQNFQVLQDPLSPVARPYGRLPQLLVNANRQDFHGFDVSFMSEYVDFHHPTDVLGRRLIVNPGISLPLVTPSAYITPRLGLHLTQYSLDRTAPGVPRSVSRTLPTLSVDSGLVLEREAVWRGQNFLQTLEPRLFYVAIPFRDQSRIPVFDTAVADFNYAQIFSENSFVGGDRINDANQLTMAVTSRLLLPSTGQEILRGTIAQRHYFNEQRVTLNSVSAPRTFFNSDWLASVSGRIAPNWTAETASQYNPRDERVERLTVSTRYQPDYLKTVNISYRFLRDQIRQMDVSGQWPIAHNWYGLARFNYSLRDNRAIENLAGIEYNGDCWVGRVVFQRFAIATGTMTNAFFIQLELNGFSRIGSNPLETLKRNIPGYFRLNQPEPANRPFDFYG